MTQQRKGGTQPIRRDVVYGVEPRSAREVDRGLARGRPGQSKKNTTRQAKRERQTRKAQRD